MSPVTAPNPREAARRYLAQTTGSPAPGWRIVTELGLAEEVYTLIAPVCPDEDHDQADPGAYSCCPEPIIDALAPEVAAYLVQLLNADRDQLGGGE
ncbi:hypothetical protein [Streptomyces sp. URMC 129]|uniref:hypothetical protein n=1 Tax=Streptomyces sp. URMC 129 TaxID=3423407 RepID=UPI003F1A2833